MTPHPEPEERLRALAMATTGKDDGSLFVIGASDEDVTYLLATKPAAVLALLDEVQRLRAERSRWSAHTNDNAEIARKALEENERLRSSLAEAEHALLHYGRHKRGCLYPDRDCACGFDAIVNPLVAAALHTAEDTPNG